ncbi:MAG: inositol monophosphatase [Propionibacteriaceae bacterium]|nr:inositol monophosphatase [Propionibacteriaceae bacterium]
MSFHSWDLDDLLTRAIGWVRAGAELIGSLSRDALRVEHKGTRNDLVTQVDREVEALIRSRIGDETGWPVVGEEFDNPDDTTGPCWYLDPIDGTMNFVQTGRDYAISLALYDGEEPVLAVVLDVVRDECYTAIAGRGAHCNGERLASVDPDRGLADGIVLTDLKEILALPRLTAAIAESRGHRRYGSAALECVEVAAGRAGAFVHLWVSPWDIAAARLICTECGVRFTRLDATTLRIGEPGSVLVAPPRTHQELVSALLR